MSVLSFPFLKYLQFYQRVKIKSKTLYGNFIAPNLILNIKVIYLFSEANKIIFTYPKIMKFLQ
jgi:hypothetical protein